MTIKYFQKHNKERDKEIKRLAETGTLSYAQIAKKFKISRQRAFFIHKRNKI
jgi:DNA-binding CsgD family transcriptional regulator